MGSVWSQSSLWVPQLSAVLPCGVARCSDEMTTTINYYYYYLLSLLCEDSQLYCYAVLKWSSFSFIISYFNSSVFVAVSSILRGSILNSRFSY